MNYTSAKSSAFSVFRFSDPIAFLNQALEEKKKRNRKFSLRAWARQLGLSEPTPLSQILNSKRALPIHYVPKLSKSLNLGAGEQEYLENIVRAKFAKSSEEKEKFLTLAKATHSREATLTNYIDDDFKLFQEPLTMVLLLLAECPDFKMDYAWIQKRLRHPLSVEEIQAAYELFLAKGFLKLESDGRYSMTEKFISTRNDVGSIWVKRFHENCSQLAAAAVQRQSLEEREFASHLLTIRKDSIPEMKQMIRDFTKEMVARFSIDESHPDSIYHLNLQLFSATRHEDESK